MTNLRTSIGMKFKKKMEIASKMSQSKGTALKPLYFIPIIHSSYKRQTEYLSVNWNSSCFSVSLLFKIIMGQEMIQGWKKPYETT